MVRANIAKTISTDKTGGHWRKGDAGYTHICKNLKDNFIDLQAPKMCCIKGGDDNWNFRMIKYHTDAKSLNSSQVMCINFFKKFFEDPQYEGILLYVLRQSGINIPIDSVIKDAVFEYEPDESERTSFDFFMRLSDGQHISFEIKYTESGFGGISACPSDSDRYARKWINSYAELVQNCPYLTHAYTCNNDFLCVKNGKLTPKACVTSDKCSIYKFYENYQICRNICFAKESNDIVAFLTPRKNDSLDAGRRFIDGFRNPNIVNIYWEELIDKVLSSVLHNKTLNNYYSEFKTKYIDIVP